MGKTSLGGHLETGASSTWLKCNLLTSKRLGIQSQMVANYHYKKPIFFVMLKKCRKMSKKTGMMSTKHDLKSDHLQRPVHYDVQQNVYDFR